MTAKRVLTLGDHLGSIGGTEAAQLAVFQGLARRGWEVHLLYVSRGDFWPEWQSLAATATEIGASLPTRASPAASTAGALRAVFRGARIRPSVIYVHSAGHVPVALGMASVVRAPVVAHLHLPPPLRQPQWLNTLIRRASVVVVPSSDTARRWTDAAALDPARTTVVPTGIDPDRFVPLGDRERAEVRKGIGVGTDERMVLYAGRVEHNKGAHVLIEAVDHTPTPVHLVVCGDARDEAYLAGVEALMGVRNATYLGRRTDVASLMGAADLVVVPSSVAETQGLVIGEALACGTPVVAFDVGGIADSMSGFPDQLVGPGDTAQLAEAIERFAGWRRTDPGLGRRSRDWAVGHLSLDRSVEVLEGLISGA
ncbi:MAG: glycosyltransferase family 4 protein [Acidimicrobiales bacterium]